MDRIAFPLERFHSATVGTKFLRAAIPLWICVSPGKFEDINAYRKLTFRFDTGSDFTQMSLETARDFGIEVPDVSLIGQLTTAIGTTLLQFRPGRLAFRVRGLEKHLFDVPCMYFVDRPSIVPPILGLSGLLNTVPGNKVRLMLEGPSTPDFADGSFTIEILPGGPASA